MGGCAPRCIVSPDAIDLVARHRGLSFDRVPKCRTLTQSELATEIRASITRHHDPKRLVREGELFRALGFIPETFRYPEDLYPLYAGHLLAVYEQDGEEILFRKGVQLRRDLLGHELTHALQDQRYDLNQLLDPRLTSDQMFARSALLEGDANVIGRKIRGDLSCGELSEQELVTQLGSIFLNAKSLPPALEVMTTFPYLFGERYVCALRKKGGAALLDRAFASPPGTSREIIRFESETPSKSGDSSVESLGQLSLFIFLLPEIPVSQAWQIADGWRDDEVNQDLGRIQWSLRMKNQAQAMELAEIFIRLRGDRQRGWQIVAQGEKVILSAP